MSATSVAFSSSRGSGSTLDTLLSDEILLRLCYFLSPLELTRLQRVCRRLRRIAEDPQIWKTLFFDHFVRQESYPSLSSSSSSASASASRLPTLPDLERLLCPDPHIRPQRNSKKIGGLPHRYYSDDDLRSRFHTEDFDGKGKARLEDLEEIRNDGLDWQGLYRVSCNWHRGNFSIFELLSAGIIQDGRGVSRDQIEQTLDVRRPLLSALPPEPSIPPTETDDTPERANTLVQYSSNLIFTASRLASEHPYVYPSVQIYPDSSEQHSSEPHDPTTRRPIISIPSERLAATLKQRHVNDPVTITDLRADQSGTRKTIDSKGQASLSIDLFVAYSSQHWSVFRIRMRRSSASICAEDVEEILFEPSITGPAKTSVVMSAFHWPILATCTSDFCVAIYALSSSAKAKAHLLHKLRSFTCYWPATMTLGKLSSDSQQNSPLLGKRAREVGDDGVEDTPPAAKRPFASLRDRRSQRATYRPTGVPDKTSDAQVYQLGFAYSSPSYPDNWTVSFQELLIEIVVDEEGNCMPSRSSVTSRYATAAPRLSAGTSPRRPASRRRRCPKGEADGEADSTPSSSSSEVEDAASHFPSSTPSTPRSIFSNPPPSTPPHFNSTTRAKSITYEHPFVVVGCKDNLLEVYELQGSASCSESNASSDIEPTSLTARPLRLVQRKVFFGMGSVLSVALKDGRCVSGGSDGTLMVWSLLGGNGVGIADADRGVDDEDEALVTEVKTNDDNRKRMTRSTTPQMSHVVTLRCRSVSPSLDDEVGNRASPHAHAQGETIQSVPTQRLSDLVSMIRRKSSPGLQSSTPRRLVSASQFPSATSTSTPTPTSPTLSETVPTMRYHASSRPSVIKWVSTAFDRVVSVSTSTSPSCRAHASSIWRREDEQREIAHRGHGEMKRQVEEEERVQIWSFA